MTDRIDAIHIGFHRCASTTLQADILAGHPDIAFTKRGKVALNPERTLADVTVHGDGERPPKITLVSAEGLCGVNYAGTSNVPGPSWSDNSRLIHRKFPEAKILILIRRQPDLIRSYYSLALVKHGLTATPRRYCHELFPLGCLHYDQIMCRYADLFGPDRVKVLPVELLMVDPPAFLAALSEFLGVDVTRSRLRRRNAGGGDLANAMLRRANMVLGPLIQGRALESPKKRLRAALTWLLPESKGFYGSVDEADLRARYRESNLRMQSLIGYDLIGRFGY